MAISQFAARTPHCGDAHNAPLTPICRSRGFSEKGNAPSAIMKALMGRCRGKTTVNA